MAGFESDQRRYSEAHYGAPSYLMSIIDPEIGNGSVIAAGSFVTRSIPPGSIAGGSRARVFRRRGDQRAEAEVRKVDIPFRASGAG